MYTFVGTMTGKKFVKLFIKICIIILKVSLEVWKFVPKSSKYYFEHKISSDNVMYLITVVFPSHSHAQALAAVHAYTHWISQYYSEAQRQGRHHDKFLPLVTNIADGVVPLIHKEVRLIFKI